MKSGPVIPSRILFIRGGALGDFIVTLPAVRALRRTWPDARIELVGRPEFASLAVLCGLADRDLSLDSARFAAYFVTRATLPPAECEWLRSFDLVFPYQAKLYLVMNGLIMFLTKEI